jgi:hypothetical protein
MKKVSPLEEALAKLLDTQFRIPGTGFTFGLDPILGLLPGIGDAISSLLQIYLVFSFFKKGVSGELAARITFNVLLDTVFGSLPVLGQIWDFWFKANQRNQKLALEHWQNNKYQGSGWPYWLLLIFLLIGVTVATVYVITVLVNLLVSLFSGS